MRFLFFFFAPPLYVLERRHGLTRSRTEDGAHVSVAFAGIVKIDDAIAAILEGKKEAKSTEFGSVVTNNSFKVSAHA